MEAFGVMGLTFGIMGMGLGATAFTQLQGVTKELAAAALTDSSKRR